MKKRSLVAAALLLAGVCLFTGCKSKNKLDISSSHTSAPAETMADTAAVTTEAQTKASETTEVPAQSGSAQTSGFTTTLSTYSSGKVSVEYPIVSKMEDSAAEASVNKLLKDNALSVIKANGVDEGKDTLAVKCKVLSIDRKRITAVYTGKLGASQPVSLFFTNTVDLSKAENVGFSTYADPYTMAGYVMSDDCQLYNLPAETAAKVKEHIKGQSVDYYNTLFKNADFPLKDSTFPESFSYERQGEIYFSIPVPHTLGDYAIVKFTPETK